VTAWRFPELFELDSDLQPVRVAGVPPDFFSKTGQRWGNPLYRWDVMRSQGYDWWIKRIRWTLTLCDIVRLDHFRGFEAYWAIPAADETAVNGKWVPGPGFDLFVAMRAQLGDLPFIAEDLGTITPEVERLRDGLGLPGMRILQFGFSDRGAHAYLPHRYTVNSVVYTGTHDNDTTRGWWKNGATAQEKAAVNAYLGQAKDGVVWGLIRAALGSVAEICIIPAQDVLELDGDARMNLPSKADGNWAWRLHKGQLTAEVAKKLAEICEVSDRDGVFVAREKAQASAADQQGHGKAGEEFAA
jgi:4-alpha-glucanotransferase